MALSPDGKTLALGGGQDESQKPRQKTIRLWNLSDLTSKPPAGVADFRTWTSTSGKFTVEAQFVEVADEQVILKDRDGKTIHVALKDLYAVDQEYVKQLKAQGEKVSDTVSDTATPLGGKSPP